MKVLKVLHIIPTLSSGGAEKMLVDIVIEMKKRDIEVEVLVLSRQGDFYSKKIIEVGIPVHFGTVDKVYHPTHIWTIIQFLKKDFDVIHAHLFAPQFFTAIAKKLTRKKVSLVTTEHNTHNRRRERKVFKILDNWMYHQYDQIIAITQGTKEELNRYLPNTREKTVVIENGIRLDQYENAKPIDKYELVPNYKEGDKLILMVAAMREQKDHETVIRASKLLPSNYHILFVGDGERLDKVKKYAKEYGSPNIHFLGRRSDVPSIMKSSDVFVLSSHWEGFGLVAVEAMAAGLPVIASNVLGLSEVIDDGGILFEKGNEIDLCEKIIALSEDIQMRKKIISKSAKRIHLYNVVITTERYYNLYTRYLNNK
mgnify:FL=1